MSGGWLAGFVLSRRWSLTTLVLGLRFVFVRTPWQPTYHRGLLPPSSASAAESVIIDSDHWRHYFLLLGVMWGLMAASRPYRAAPRRRRIVGVPASRPPLRRAAAAA